MKKSRKVPRWLDKALISVGLRMGITDSLSKRMTSLFLVIVRKSIDGALIWFTSLWQMNPSPWLPIFVQQTLPIYLAGNSPELFIPTTKSCAVNLYDRPHIWAQNAKKKIYQLTSEPVNYGRCSSHSLCKPYFHLWKMISKWLGE